MPTALELYGLLILTVLGFTLPILTVLVSVFPEGVKALYAKSDNERRQSEENIVNETKKKQSEKGLDYAALEVTLKSLKRKKRLAERKLEYLNPSKLIVKIATPFAVAFLALLLALADFPLIVRLAALFLSVVGLGSGIGALFASVSVLVEVSEIVNDARRTTEERVVELLSTLVEKSGVDTLFLKRGAVYIRFNDKKVKEGEAFEFSVNRKHEVPVAITNSVDTMAKNVQVGLILPKEVLIDKTPNLQITTTEETQIVRFNADMIHAHEESRRGKMGVTFLRVGEYNIDTFIKGENVRYQRLTFKLRAIE